MLGHIGVEQRSSSTSSKVFPGVLRGTEHGLNSVDLMFYKAVRPWKVGKGSYVVNVMVLEELYKLIGSKQRAIVFKVQGQKPILGDELM